MAACLSNVANDLLKKIKANQPENLTEENDYLGTIPKGKMIKIFLESLLDRENTDIQMIALYGEWGSGKTSLMNYVKEQLDEEDAFKTVFFPSWEMEKDDNLSLSLLESMIESEDDVDKTSIKEAFLAIGMGICKGLSAKIGPINVNFKEVVQSVEEYNKSITDDSALKRIKKFKEEYSKLENLILEKTKCEKLVVFIDDLDRCAPENVLNLLSAIKLFFIFGNRTIFICGLDEKAVDEAVKVKYKDVVKSGEYMEKIFDISFDMPKPNINKMIAYYFDDAKFNSILTAGAQINNTIVPDYAEVVNGIQKFFEAMHFMNPRHIKKVLNKYLLLRYYQENGLDRDGLIPDQNIEFFRYLTLFIVMLYKFEPDNFNTIKNYEGKISFYLSGFTTDSKKYPYNFFGEWVISPKCYENISYNDIRHGSLNLDQKYKADNIKDSVTGLMMAHDHAKAALITLFSPKIDGFVGFDNAYDFEKYYQQFYKENNLLSHFCGFIEKSIQFKEDNGYKYRLWNIFDMAERYL